MKTSPVISVGIVSGPAIDFELTGDFSAGPDGTPLTGPARAFSEGQKVIVEWAGHRTGGDHEFLISPVDPVTSTFLLRNVTIGVKFHWERKEDQRFSGSLKLVAQGDNVVAVNVVPLEEYLVSVISSEMSAASSTNLLQAHAITSRSWLLAQLEKSRRIQRHPLDSPAVVQTPERRVRWYDREDHELYDVCADDHCQRYQGITVASSPNVRAAVNNTNGRVLTHEGTICDARFSKSCGGITEPFAMVWEPTHFPYLVSIVDRDRAAAGPSDVHAESDAQAWIRSSPEAFCNTTDHRVLSQVLPAFDLETVDFHRWKVTYSQEVLAELIKEKSGIDFGGIVDLLPVERGPSGRLSLLKIVGEKHILTIGKELEIRRTLSASHLYSSAFIVEKSERRGSLPESFVLRGAGWGHGVGLCQIGAAVMGEKGYPPEAILKHYFSGAAIEQAYE